MHAGSSSSNGLPAFLFLPEFSRLSLPPLPEITTTITRLVAASTDVQSTSEIAQPISTTFPHLSTPEALTAPSLPGTPTGWSSLSVEMRTLVIAIPIVALTLLCAVIGACLNRTHASYRDSTPGNMPTKLDAATAPAGNRPPLVSLYEDQRPKLHVGRQQGTSAHRTYIRQPVLPTARASRRSRSLHRRDHGNRDHATMPTTPQPARRSTSRPRPSHPRRANTMPEDPPPVLLPPSASATKGDDDTTPLIFFVHARRTASTRSAPALASGHQLPHHQPFYPISPSFHVPKPSPTTQMFPQPFYSTPSSSCASFATALSFHQPAPPLPPPSSSRGRSRTRQPRSDESGKRLA
ncbi:hypothetical protein HDU88_005160 [Geranomyces variabilis]|nr:hypothetical protein HDU88_005160 [Geranomyces variabilis]